MKTLELCRRSIGAWACLSWIACSAACGGDDDAKQVVPAIGADGGPGTFSLKGDWTTFDFECRNSKRSETVRISVFDTTITATKVEGNDCVPAGYVAFEGKLPKALLTEADLPIMFSYKLYDGAAADPRSIAVVESGMGKILQPDAFVLSLKSTQLRFSRAVGDDTGDDETTTAGGSNRSGFKPDDGGSGASSRAGAGGNGGSGGSKSSATAGRGGSGAAGSSGRDEEAGTAGKGGAGDDEGAAGDDAEAGRGASGASGRGAAGSGAASSCKGPLLPGATCDHVAQCGCAKGENCRFDGAKPPSCFPAGEADAGEECREDSDCAAGVCVAGLCAQMCRKDDDCNGHCVGVLIDDEEVDGYLACLEQCDPVLASVCYLDPRPNTPACRPCKNGATCLPTELFAGCFAAATVSLRDPGESCTDDDQCFGGGCFEGKCAPWCRDDTDCSDPGAMCKTGEGYFANEGDEIGYCTPGFSQDDEP